MKARTLAAVPAGLVVGYLVWLGVAAGVTATTPVHLWVAITAALLLLLSAAAFVAGRSSPAARYFFWSSPLMSLLASIYVLAIAAF